MWTKKFSREDLKVGMRVKCSGGYSFDPIIGKIASFNPGTFSILVINSQNNNAHEKSPLWYYFFTDILEIELVKDESEPKPVHKMIIGVFDITHIGEFKWCLRVLSMIQRESLNFNLCGISFHWPYGIIVNIPNLVNAITDIINVLDWQGSYYMAPEGPEYDYDKLIKLLKDEVTRLESSEKHDTCKDKR